MGAGAEPDHETLKHGSNDSAATFVGGCEKNGEVTILNDPDPRGTKWVLEFDDKTKLKSVAEFNRALNDASDRWERNVKIGNILRDDITEIPENHPVYTPRVTHYPREEGTASAHVTQRVGLYNYEDYKNVLDQIQDP